MPTHNNRPSPEALLKALEDAKKILETSAQTNRNLFIAFNSVLVTVLILCLSVTDEMLLLGSSTIKLPLLNVDLPIWAFATIAPLALVALHFDLLQNLSAHREKLIAWCLCWFKVYPSPSRNADMTRQLYPFLFDYAWIYANHIESPTIGARLLPRLCWLLYCWGAYTVLVIFFVRFAELQHYGYTSWHLLLLIFDALILYWYWLGFTQGTKLAAWKLVLAVIIAPLSLIPYWGGKVLNRLKLSRTKILFLWFSNLVALWTLLLFTLIQVHIDCDKLPTWTGCDTSPRLVKWALERETEIRSVVDLNLVPRLTLVGFRLKLPDDFFTLDKLQYPEKKENQFWQETFNALYLAERRLAFANFGGVQLPHSNFRFAQLQGASFEYAKLQGASFQDAKLQGANLDSAQLQGASLDNAQLQGASLWEAQLQSAGLVSSQLQSANLKKAQMQGTNLSFAQLQGADISYAKLQGANLESARLQGTVLESAELQGATLEDAELQGADIWNAQLQGANLKKAQMQGVLLIDTQLKGITLDSQQLESSWTQRLDWQNDYDFTQFKSESWTQSQNAQQQLEQTQQRVKDFKSPQLPLSSANKEKFATIWLDLLCKDDYVTKAMLKQLRPFREHPVTKAQAQQYLNSQKQCEPYRTLLKN